MDLYVIKNALLLKKSSLLQLDRYIYTLPIKRNVVETALISLSRLINENNSKIGFNDYNLSH